jgi:glycosyltransferase involved in cell wall biosynthesis
LVGRTERRSDLELSRPPETTFPAGPSPAGGEGGHGEMAPRPRSESMVFLWDSFGPHHVDCCEACAARFAGRLDVYGVEVATIDANYQWRTGSESRGFAKYTLFPGKVRQKIGTLRCAWRILSTCLRLRSRYLFLCHYESPATFLSAFMLRLLGRRLIIMQDSKFDDKQRFILRELAKGLFYRPYHAALVAGCRSRDYLQFLGFRRERIFVGYDAVSVDRVRQLAQVAPAPDGVPHGKRHFTVIARFVAKKNLSLALEAYAAYVAQADGPPRELHFCGSGELEGMLHEQAQQLGLSGVRFHGYLSDQDVARKLGSTLALILPSIEEQHGLVINEALAMGVPVLISDNCGARDLLVRSGVNGYIFETDNSQGLAHFMGVLDRDKAEWERMSRATQSFTPLADTTFFVAAVEQAIAQLSGRPHGTL